MMKAVFLLMLFRHILAFNDDRNLDDSLNLLNRRSLEQKSLCVGSVTSTITCTVAKTGQPCSSGSIIKPEITNNDNCNLKVRFDYENCNWSGQTIRLRQEKTIITINEQPFSLEETHLLPGCSKISKTVFINICTSEEITTAIKIQGNLVNSRSFCFGYKFLSIPIIPKYGREPAMTEACIIESKITCTTSGHIPCQDIMPDINACYVGVFYNYEVCNKGSNTVYTKWASISVDNEQEKVNKVQNAIMASDEIAPYTCRNSPLTEIVVNTCEMFSTKMTVYAEDAKQRECDSFSFFEFEKKNSKNESVPKMTDHQKNERCDVTSQISCTLPDGSNCDNIIVHPEHSCEMELNIHYKWCNYSSSLEADLSASRAKISGKDIVITENSYGDPFIIASQQCKYYTHNFQFDGCKKKDVNTSFRISGKLPNNNKCLSYKFLSFSIKVQPKKEYNIELQNLGNITKFNDYFISAKSKWESIIIGDVKDIPFEDVDIFGRVAPANPAYGIVESVHIGYDFVETLDDPESNEDVLGFAGPIYIRIDQNNNKVSTISGVMTFDLEDLEDMDQSEVELIILHEMGHVLGIGSLFNFRCGKDCFNGDSKYSCPKANEEYHKLGFTDDLSLEKEFCGHWAESNFNNMEKSELMTPEFERGKYQPISSVTVGALQDLGYEVNFDAADPWESSYSRRYATEIVPQIPTSSFFLNESMFQRPKVNVIKY